MNKEKKIYLKAEYFFIAELIVVFIMVWSAIWKKDVITSSMISINFLIVMGLFICSFLSSPNNRIDKNLFWLIISIIIVSLLSIIQTAFKIDFNYIKRWIMFICTLILYYWIFNTEVTEIMVRLFLKLGVGLAILFIIAYLIGQNGMINEVLTFNLENPNFTGFCLLNVFLCLITGYDFEKKRFIKMIHIILAAIMLYFINMTEARSCLMAAIAFVLLKLVYHTKYNKGITFVVVIFPIIFAIVYMKIVHTDFMDHFNFAVSEGKTLTSRYQVWKEGFDIIKQNLWFGNYYQVTTGRGFRQLHNIHVDTIATYGILVFLLVIIYLNRIINKIGNNIITRRQMTGMIAFYAISFAGIFEAALFSGSKGIYLFSGGFLMLAKYKESEKQ